MGNIPAIVLSIDSRTDLAVAIVMASGWPVKLGRIIMGLPSHATIA